ncbi:MAG: dTDP-4-dehydrorhamnose reductase [Saprospiraceae bacterium]|nr:dTDP-4-dehydrorhamnose reductase [Saprospiraceae bacterium]
MIKILVTGAGGQLGLEFAALVKDYPQFEFHFYTRHDLDILEEKALGIIADEINPDYVVNCAAYTAVDKAEVEKSLCYNINTHACRSLCNVFGDRNTKIVHYSTDYVYHTCLGRPLDEDCPTEPKSEYAKSKLEGEYILRNSQIPALIIRTSWVFSSFGSNFVKTMLRLSESKDQISVVYDQIGTPTFTYDLAIATLSIIEKTHAAEGGLKLFNDVYNYSNEGVTSWYDFATFIMKIDYKKTKVLPITSDQYPTLAKRPVWSLLSKEKIKNNFAIDIPHWHDALDRCFKQMNTSGSN